MKTLFFHEGGQTVEQVAQSVCGVSGDPWRYSKPEKTRLWATQPAWPCSEQGWWTRQSPGVPSSPSQPVTAWVPLWIANGRWEDTHRYAHPYPTAQLFSEIQQCADISQTSPNYLGQKQEHAGHVTEVSCPNVALRANFLLGNQENALAQDCWLTNRNIFSSFLQENPQQPDWLNCSEPRVEII